MGINGLLKALQHVQTKRHISEFRGRKIGVDAYTWLHKAAVCCAADLVMEKPTEDHLKFCLKRLKLLTDNGVQPYFVFDGRSLPAKEPVNRQRAQRRQIAKEKALELMSNDSPEIRQQSFKYFIQAVRITPETANQLFRVLKDMNIDSIVAPYEADAQLGYLEICGYVDAVLSEDSDILLHGCKNVLYKLNEDGFCWQIQQNDLSRSGLLTSAPFTLDTFILACTLSGCDYLGSIKGIGIKRAFKLVNTYGSDIHNLIRGAEIQSKLDVPKSYKESLLQTLKIFRHQTVYEPEKKQLTRRRREMPATIDVDIDSDVYDFYLGSMNLSRDIMLGVCNGRLNPMSFEPFTASVIHIKNGEFSQSKNVSKMENLKKRSAITSVPMSSHTNPKRIASARSYNRRQKECDVDIPSIELWLKTLDTRTNNNCCRSKEIDDKKCSFKDSPSDIVRNLQQDPIGCHRNILSQQIRKVQSKTLLQIGAQTHDAEDQHRNVNFSHGPTKDDSINGIKHQTDFSKIEGLVYKPSDNRSLIHNLKELTKPRATDASPKHATKSKMNNSTSKMNNNSISPLGSYSSSSSSSTSSPYRPVIQLEGFVKSLDAFIHSTARNQGGKHI